MAEEIRSRTAEFSASELEALVSFVESRLLLPIYAQILERAGQSEAVIAVTIRVLRSAFMGLGHGLSIKAAADAVPEGDHLITLQQCAEILGFENDRWLREHEAELPFIVRLSRKEARASWSGVQAFMRARGMNGDGDGNGNGHAKRSGSNGQR